MLNKRDQALYDSHECDSGWSTRDLNMVLAERNRIEGTNIKPCKECRDGEHGNYDDDVRLVTVKWDHPEPQERCYTRAYLCSGHQSMKMDDGYTVTELSQPNR